MVWLGAAAGEGERRHIVDSRRAKDESSSERAQQQPGGKSVALSGPQFPPPENDMVGTEDVSGLPQLLHLVSEEAEAPWGPTGAQASA